MESPNPDLPPQAGDVWYSHRTGYRVLVCAMATQGRVSVSDGKSHYLMFLSHFKDPRNDWICEKRR